MNNSMEELRNRKRAIKLEIYKTKQALKRTDYKCLKYVDGALTEAEYAETKAERAELRNKINELEAELAEIH